MSTTNTKFEALIEELKKLHYSKSNDYAQAGNFYSNFEGTAALVGVDVDTVFRVMMGIKLMRLRELMGGKTPNNESIQDSRKDLTNYALLYASYFMDLPSEEEMPV